MSQVKNLRAMFENKGDTSPPDRGRSSAVSSPRRPLEGASPGGSPRPLSKVRTNFVAVEKDGRMGLRMDHSAESSLSRRRMSTETADTEPNSVSLERSYTRSAEDAVKTSRRFLPDETIPESPKIDKGIESPENLQTMMNNEGNDVDSSAAEQRRKNCLRAGEAELSSVSEKLENSKTKGDSHVSSPASRSTATGTRTSTVATSATKMRSKEPIGGQKQPALENELGKGLSGGSACSKNISKSTMAKTGSSGTARKTRLPAAKSQGGTSFVKPTPKSPTKPAHLPLSLTAPTASSGSKVNVPRQSLSRQAGTFNTVTTPPKASTARTNASTTDAAGIPAKSTVSRSRPSLGPPPSRQKHTSSSKKQSNVDEGFLARMMRPTQSSSSKATDKSPSTPPKKVTPCTGRSENRRRPGAGRAGSLRPEQARSNKSLGMQPFPPESKPQNNNCSKAVPPVEDQEHIGVAGDEFSLSFVSPSPEGIGDALDKESAKRVPLEVDTEGNIKSSLDPEVEEKSSNEYELSNTEQVLKNATLSAVEFEPVDDEKMGPSNGNSISTGLTPAVVVAQGALWDRSQEAEVTKKDELSTEKWPTILPKTGAKLEGMNTFDSTMHSKPVSANGSIVETIADQPSQHEHDVPLSPPMTATKQAKIVTDMAEAESNALGTSAPEKLTFSIEGAGMPDYKEARLDENNIIVPDFDDDLSIQGIDLNERTDLAAISDSSKTLTSHLELPDHKPVENMVLSSQEIQNEATA